MHVSIRAASNELSRRPVLVSPHETVVIVFPDDPNRFRRELDEEENWVSKEMSGRDERTGFYYCYFVRNSPLLLWTCRIFRDIRYVFIHHRDDLDSWRSIRLHSKSCILVLTDKNSNFDNLLLISFSQSEILGICVQISDGG